MRVFARMALFLFLPGLLLNSGCLAPKRLPPIVEGPVPIPEPRPVGPVLLGVGLVESAIPLTTSTTGPALLLDGESGRRLARTEAGARLVCKRAGGLVAWDLSGESGRAGSVVLQPIDPGHRLGYREQEYRGDFLVITTPGSAGLTLINNVDLEGYLRGVVPWEIGRPGPDKRAAVEAQAVAARTYTISHLGSRKSRGFDVYASVMDQVYKGSRDEDALCNEAVAATAGLVLRHAGREIDAFYSACCGGVTSQVEEVWPREGRSYLVSHLDAESASSEAFCAGSKYFHWRESWSAALLTEILQETLPEYIDYMSQAGRSEWAGPVFSPRRNGARAGRPGRLLDLEIQGRTRSGRVARLAVTTEAGVYHVRGDRVRWVLRPADGGPAILRSALFEVELVHRAGGLAEVAVRGRGFGHGVGLCQTGALDMADRGYGFREILGHYYPGATLVPLPGTEGGNDR